MSNKTRIERPNNTIKGIISPVSTSLKVKMASAMQVVVNKIKEKHLS